MLSARQPPCFVALLDNHIVPATAQLHHLINTSVLHTRVPLCKNANKYTCGISHATRWPPVGTAQGGTLEHFWPWQFGSRVACHDQHIRLYPTVKLTASTTPLQKYATRKNSTICSTIAMGVSSHARQDYQCRHVAPGGTQGGTVEHFWPCWFGKKFDHKDRFGLLSLFLPTPCPESPLARGNLKKMTHAQKNQGPCCLGHAQNHVIRWLICLHNYVEMSKREWTSNTRTRWPHLPPEDCYSVVTMKPQ